ncbi:hypothetical protein JO965_30880 (plasmid) [Microvirga sp. VF16]|nr:hypothetical protein JO965_30880 [Microvirga sp. VF16]
MEDHGKGRDSARIYGSGRAHPEGFTKKRRRVCHLLQTQQSCLLSDPVATLLGNDEHGRGGMPSLKSGQGVIGFREAPAIGGLMNRTLGDLDTAAMSIEKIAQKLVVVAWDVHKTTSPVHLAEEFLNDVIVFLGPIPTRFQSPAVNDVADELDRAHVDLTEEIKKGLALAALCPEMQVGDDKSTISMCDRRPCGSLAIGSAIIMRLVSQSCDTRNSAEWTTFCLILAANC